MSLNKPLCKTFSLLLILALTLTFAACTQDTPSDSAVGEIQASKTAEETSTYASTQATSSENVMRADALYTYSDSYVLGGDVITREEVLSVTFLDTLKNAPDTAWDASAEQNGSVMAWVENGHDLYIAGENGVTASSCKGLFCNYLNVASIRFNGCFFTNTTTDMCDMFANCMKLSSVDVASLDTGNVQNMTDLFYFCSSLTQLDLSGWNVSNVKEAKKMFYYCSNLTDIGCTLNFPLDCIIDDIYTDSGLN